MTTLHSINTKEQKAIIEHQGRLIEVDYEFEWGRTVLTEKSILLCESEGLCFASIKSFITEYLELPESLNRDSQTKTVKQYSAYKIDVSDLQEVDIYELHNRYKIDDPSGCIQHASKKLLLAGKRTGGKPKHKDIQEAIDTLKRWLQLNQ